ncbi:Unconventional myosin-XV [Eumeta japonica]|uniref:Unconventional myosin-XV n=1 Tax=Eumeta variegata TaxID=151549 RepID=A0A4C1SUP1_EUMVA|nr:Unconventional myosin-XV [Eumeta japonica]
MNKNESQTKSSTLSSGVRAAAQTLNVPIERLESRQSNHREQTSNASHIAVPQQHNTRNISPPIMSGLFEEQHVHHQQSPLQLSQHIGHQQQPHKREQLSQKCKIIMGKRRTLCVLMRGIINLKNNKALFIQLVKVPLNIILQIGIQIIDSRTHGRDTSDRSSNRPYAELVKWQSTPIDLPLLRLPNDLAPLAIECFDCILRYCGDIPMDPDLTEVKCVYTVLMGIESETEQQEFSLYCIVQGDAFTMPLAADEYILDVTTELLKSGQPFYLIFCRSVWHFSLKRDPAPTPLYVEVLFNQVAPDYLEGLLLELPSTGVPPPEVVRDMARIASLLHRAVT